MKFSTPTTTACLCFLVALAFYLGSGKATDHPTRPEPELSASTPPLFSTGLSSQPLATDSTQPVAPFPESVPEVPTVPPLHGASFPGTPPKIALGSGPLGWELQLKEVKNKAADETSAAVAILRMLSYLPEEALETAVEQALEKLPDEAWAPTAGPFLANPASHVRVLSILFADLMERPQTVSLPALAGLAKNPSHPFASFALDNLRLFLGEDLNLADLPPNPATEPKENPSFPKPNPEAPR